MKINVGRKVMEKLDYALYRFPQQLRFVTLALMNLDNFYSFIYFLIIRFFIDPLINNEHFQFRVLF